MLSPSWTFRDIHKIQGRSSSNSGYKIQKICGWKIYSRRAPLAREYTKSNIRVKRWHKYENSEIDWETQFLFHFILLNKFNRTEIQTYKVEERTFGTPFTGVMLNPTELWNHFCWELVNYVFICSRERHECDRCIWNKSYKYCRKEIKWRMILAVVNAIYATA